MTDDGAPDPLPDDIAKLLRDERSIPRAPSLAREQIAARLRVTLDPSSLSHTHHAGGTSGVVSGTVVAAGVRNLPARAKLAALLLSVGAVTTSVFVWRAKHAPQRAPVAMDARAHTNEPRAIEPTNEPRAIAPDAGPLELPVNANTIANTQRVEMERERDAGIATTAYTHDAGHSSETHAGAIASAHGERVERDESDQELEDERVLLMTARAAIGRRDGAAALESLEAHKRAHPHGRLVQEREAMRVQALRLAGRDDEAARAADAFTRRYPESALLPVVQRAVEPAQ